MTERGSPGHVFGALADPTRRLIIEWLEQGGTATATELAARLPMSRQAVAKHLVGLADAGLIAGTKRGREVRYTLDPGGLDAAAAWLKERAARWDRSLRALAAHVEGAEERGDASRPHLTRGTERP